MACMGSEVIENLVKTYSKKAYIVAYGFFKNHYDAQDAVQEAFLQAHKSIHSFKGNSKIETWFYRILIRTCFRIQRHKKWFKWVWENPEKLQITDLLHNSGQIANDISLRFQIQDAVRHLSPKQKMVFVLRIYQEKQFSEIAEILKISESTARVQYARAVKKIKKIGDRE
jgi:RNA polymerase sigma-70 factor (ECF subfamily)